MKKKLKIPKPRLPVANKPNVVHKDKSKYDRNLEKEELRKRSDYLYDDLEDPNSIITNSGFQTTLTEEEVMKDIREHASEGDLKLQIELLKIDLNCKDKIIEELEKQIEYLRKRNG